MSKQFEARLTGSGGQGLILAAIILAEAASRAGNFVAQTQAYGPEARGGASKAEVIISSEPIDYPKVTAPDVVLTMSEEAYRKYGVNCKDDCVLLVDSTNIENTGANPKAIFLPLTQAAKEQLGTPIVANIVALGALNALTSIVKPDDLKDVVLERAPRGTEELNAKALQLGYSLAQTVDVDL